MNILWIPHSSWESSRSRDHYFIEQMKKKHEIHVLTWTQPRGARISHFLNPKLHINGFRSWDMIEDGIHFHHFPRFHATSFTPHLLRYNEKLFQNRIRRIVSDHGINLIICGPSHYLNGFPPFDLDIPIIFDHLDYVNDKNARDTYLTESDAVLCVSHDLLSYSKQFNENSHYLPNPVNISELKRGNPTRIRDEYELENSTVVSLIGLSTADSYYLIDTYPIVKEKIDNVKYLIVGRNHHYEQMKKKAEKYDNIIFTGWVNNIEDFFAATDIGTYPVDKTIYDNARCPIKILEYSVLGKPVVSTNINEVLHWNLPNVFISKPNTYNFSRKIIEAKDASYDLPNLDQFKIGNLASKLDRIIKEI